MEREEAARLLDIAAEICVTKHCELLYASQHPLVCALQRAGGFRCNSAERTL